MGKAIVKNRFFYRIPVELVTPISISSGNAELTDHDVILTEDGMPFVPGSSVAGAVREYIKDKKTADILFGNHSSNSTSSMSRIIFSDLVFDKNVHISVRDGIALEEGMKTTRDTGKFDYQIVETHAKGTVFIECVLYDKDNLECENVRTTIPEIIKGMNNGEIRFGFKKNRGLGRVKTGEKYFYKEFVFDKNDSGVVQNYLDFCEDIYDESKYDSATITTDDAVSENISIIKIPLRLEGGISIRTYSAVPDAPDFTHLTVSGADDKKVAVIPGSSWNGAIRARAFDILDNELGLEPEIKNILKDTLRKFWGDCGNMKFQASKIIFSESKLEGSVPVRMTRNKINRFDASTCDGALYTETAYFGGQTELEIMFRDCGKEYLWCIYLVDLALNDLKNGLLSVGGQTAVGRGIFSCDKAEYKNIDMKVARESFVSALKGGQR